MTAIADWIVPAVIVAWLALGFGWPIVEGMILPLLIPRETITRHAQDLIRRYPDDPVMAALIEEHSAWFRSEIYEQGMWRRVRWELGRRVG